MSMEKVIPPGLNYADIKPESIENMIKVVKFTPISNITQTKANDIIRFHLQGNGFYDPYSAYIKIVIEVDPETIQEPVNQYGKCLSGKALDRSAHSFIQRLVIRSQGTELERIEQYDVMAAMINDIIYSKEQRVLHNYEGFGQQVTSCPLNSYPMNFTAVDINPDDATVDQQILYAAPNLDKLPLITNCSPRIDEGLIDIGFFKLRQQFLAATNSTQQNVNQMSGQAAHSRIIGYANDGQPLRLDQVIDYSQQSNGGAIVDRGTGRVYPRLEGVEADQTYAMSQIFDLAKEPAVFAGTNAEKLAAGKVIVKSPMTYEFCIPIYSGIIGVMMPDKKLIPMSLLPLEVEFTLNPHALYPVGACTNRSYVCKSFEIFTHTLFFEQELHRSLEAVVAENGLFIHYQSFYLTPINTYGYVSSLPQYHQLGCYLKSIDAIHWVFLYNGYEQEDGPRKLSFSSHNLYQMQLRNGTELTPSEPLVGQVGGNSFGKKQRGNSHAQFMIEMYKGWNKMHDPLSDCIISPFNFNIDTPYQDRPQYYEQFINRCISIGRCQYALSLLGEEIGQNKTIVSGKKSVIPFDLNLQGRKKQSVTSYMLCFLRADFIVYVRPDLIVTRLGI